MNDKNFNESFNVLYNELRCEIEKSINQYEKKIDYVLKTDRDDTKYKKYRDKIQNLNTFLSTFYQFVSQIERKILESSKFVSIVSGVNETLQIGDICSQLKSSLTKDVLDFVNNSSYQLQIYRADIQSFLSKQNKKYTIVIDDAEQQISLQQLMNNVFNYLSNRLKQVSSLSRFQVDPLNIDAMVKQDKRFKSVTKYNQIMTGDETLQLDYDASILSNEMFDGSLESSVAKLYQMEQASSALKEALRCVPSKGFKNSSEALRNAYSSMVKQIRCLNEKISSELQFVNGIILASQNSFASDSFKNMQASEYREACYRYFSALNANKSQEELFDLEQAMDQIKVKYNIPVNEAFQIRKEAKKMLQTSFGINEELGMIINPNDVMGLLSNFERRAMSFEQKMENEVQEQVASAHAL